jgi:hypothetical protein
MPTTPTLLRRGLPAAAVLALAVAAPAAHAQATKIVLSGPTAAALKAQGVRVEAGKPATASGARLTLPTDDVAISGSTATVDHGGSVTLAAGGHTVKLTAVEVVVGKRSTLSAMVGGKRATLATISASGTRRAVEESGTYITESPLSVTAGGLKLLRSGLHKPGLRLTRLGTIDLEATPSAPAGGSDIPGAPPVPTVTGPATPGGSTTTKRPAAAVSITGGTVTWSPRTSWLGYLAASGQADAVTATAPATYDATAMAYTLPISGGWFDKASNGAVVNTGGAADFRFTSHTIDMAFGDFTFDLAASTPKAIVTVVRAEGSPKADIGARKVLDLVKLNGVTPTVSGTTVTWTDVPLTLAAEGVPLYRAYLYDSDQGKVTITATIG